MAAAATTAPWTSAWPTDRQVLVLVVGVALFGIPHGALDPWVARPVLRPLLRRAWLPVFLAAYLAAGVAMIAAWLTVPAVTLTVFLGLSVLHFGHDAPRGTLPRGLEVVVFGAGPILFPACFAPAQTAALFGLLGVGEGGLFAADRLHAVAVVAAWIWLAASVAVVAGFARRRPRSAIAPALELASCALLFAALPPLLAFSAYFCAVHAARHLADVARELAPRGRNPAVWLALRALPLTAVTLLLGLAGWRQTIDSMTVGDAGVRVVFWALAALTVPHMALLLLAPAHPYRSRS